MKIIKLLFQEIAYRKTNFFLSVFAVTIAAALFVAGPTLIDQIEKNLGILSESFQDLSMSVDNTRENLEEQTATQEDTISMIQNLEVLRDKAQEMIVALSRKITLL